MWYKKRKIIEDKKVGLAALLVLFVCSILSGALGGAMFEFLSKPDLGPDYFVVSKPQVPKTADSGELPLFETYKKLGRSAGSVFVKKSSSNSLLNSIYKEKDQIGGGFILTVDGWMVLKIKPGYSKSPLIVSVEDEYYDIKESIPDTATGLIFVKIEAKDLSPLQFSNRKIVIGEKYSVGDRRTIVGDISLSAFSNEFVYNRSSHLLSSDVLSKRMIFLDKIPVSYLGAPLVDSAGHVIGIVTDIVSDEFAVIPVLFFENKLKDVFMFKKVNRVNLGLNYLSVTDIPVLLAKTTKGSHIFSMDKPIKYIDINQVKLRNGDIITKIEEDFVEHDYGLNTILQEYSSGDTINITFMRNNIEYLTSIILE